MCTLNARLFNAQNIVLYTFSWDCCNTCPVFWSLVLPQGFFLLVRAFFLATVALGLLWGGLRPGPLCKAALWQSHVNRIVKGAIQITCNRFETHRPSCHWSGWHPRAFSTTCTPPWVTSGPSAFCCGRSSPWVRTAFLRRTYRESQLARFCSLHGTACSLVAKVHNWVRTAVGPLSKALNPTLLQVRDCPLLSLINCKFFWWGHSYVCQWAWRIRSLKPLLFVSLPTQNGCR